MGHLTIGYGRNLDAEGITVGEADLMLKNDIDSVARHLGEHAWYRQAPVPVQQVMIDMAFNLGIEGILAFKDMIAAIESREWQRAADAMLSSKAARECPSRYEENASIIRNLTI